MTKWHWNPTSYKVFLQIVYDLVVVTDNGVAVQKHGHLFSQVEPHEPGLFVLLQRQAHVPLLTDQALLVDDKTYLRWEHMFDHRQDTEHR